MGVTLPTALTPLALAGSLWVAVASGRVLTGILPAAIAAAAILLDYALWQRRRQPWHDPAVIVLLLPAIASAVWITVGGLVLGVPHDAAHHLTLEVGPGVALTGIFTTLVSYFGRHHPDE